MRRFGWRWFAVSSVVAGLILGAAPANCETRPQYGGIVRVAMRAAPMSLDPVASAAASDGAAVDSIGIGGVERLIFDTLVDEDDPTGVKPSLAASWSSSGNQRWKFQIRHGVKFSDGTLLSAELVADSLRIANPAWKVNADGDGVVVETASADPELLAELALPRNAIVKRNADNTISGTGPFHVVEWRPGRRLTLAAEEQCWRGRPFLDGIEIEMGHSYREQMTELDLGKADLVELAPELVHRAAQPGRRVLSSAPIDLLTLVFARDSASVDDRLLREALGWSIERGSIRSVLLQGAGQPAASVLPDWVSGYGFVFSTEVDLPRARQASNQVHMIPNWTLGYDGSDSMARLIAERIALNAKDAGLRLQPTTAVGADLRLVQIPLASSNPWMALASVAKLAGATLERNGGGVNEMYQAESALLGSERLIPLFHLPASYASSVAVKDWGLRPDGSWDLANAWLETRKP